MTTPTLAYRLVAGIRFIAGLYHAGVHTREDVLAQRFSVICTGSYEDYDEGGDWTLLATVTVGHCALLEEAIEMARSYLKRGCFVFDHPTYDSDDDEATPILSPVNFQPNQVVVRDAQDESVLSASIGCAEGEWMPCWLEPIYLPEEVERLEQSADGLREEAHLPCRWDNHYTAGLLYRRADELLAHIAQRDGVECAQAAIKAALARDAKTHVVTPTSIALYRSQAIT